MSEQPGVGEQPPADDSPESISDGLGAYSVDNETQLQPEDTLVGGGDPVEEGYTPPDRPQGVTAFGVTAAEEGQDETIDQRIEQQVPDPHSAYGAPQPEIPVEDGTSTSDPDPDLLGGQDPAAIPTDIDVLDERP